MERTRQVSRHHTRLIIDALATPRHLWRQISWPHRPLTLLGLADSDRI